MHFIMNGKCDNDILWSTVAKTLLSVTIRDEVSAY